MLLLCSILKLQKTMKSGFCEGRLIKWNDERGFGFIQPIDGSKEVFLHMPGMQDYNITNINESKGERWFCSEAEAIANGWVKAPK